MDPVTAIAQAAGSLFDFYGIVINAATFKNKAKWASMPDYTDPADYQRKDYTIEIIIVMMVLAFTVMAFVLRKK